MKVLYLGHYREFSGWAKAAIDQILALDSVGVDVVCRSIDLTNNLNKDLPDRIIELEEKSIGNILIVYSTYCLIELWLQKVLKI